MALTIAPDKCTVAVKVEMSLMDFEKLCAGSVCTSQLIQKSPFLSEAASKSLSKISCQLDNMYIVDQGSYSILTFLITEKHCVVKHYGTGYANLLGHETMISSAKILERSRFGNPPKCPNFFL